METLVLSVHILLALSLVILVLLQQGKGADVGAVMGGGANSLFGVSGASNLLVKMTTSVAVAFMLTSVLLVRFAAARAGGGIQAGSVDPVAGSSIPQVPAAQSQPAQGQPAQGQPAPSGDGASGSGPAAASAPDGTPVASDSAPKGDVPVPSEVAPKEVPSTVAPVASAAPAVPSAAPAKAPSKKTK